MNYSPSESSIVATSQARVEWTTSGPRDLYLLYDQAYYSEASTPDGWWQRTLALNPYHWFRLSGTVDTSPWEALQAILREPGRSSFTLPALLVALFLARAAQPDIEEQRHLFRWVAFALPQLRAHLPVGSLRAGGNELSTDTLDACLPVLINVLLEDESAVPWVLLDGAWLHMLDQLGDRLWCFVPNVTRGIGWAAATLSNRCADERPEALNLHSSYLSPSTALGYLSALRFWHEPWPTIRGLSIKTSMLEFLQLWHQALVIMDPDAPTISDTDLAWLCDGTLGAPYDGPFDHLLRDGDERDVWDHSATNWHQRIAALQQEAVGGRQHPRGCWEVQHSARWPVFSTCNVATMRVVAGAQGCWVRLIPAGASWGSVLWWRPRSRPPLHWSLALGEILTSAPVLACHVTLWQFWRDLRVSGHPSGESVQIA